MKNCNSGNFQSIAIQKTCSGLARWLAALLLTLAWPAGASAEPISCQPTRYVDGDTFDFVGDGEKTTVRVAGFDAPERGQPWGKRAMQFMRTLTEDGATCDCYKQDRYRRSVCTVWTLDGFNVVALMLIEGLGCIDPRFEREAHPDDRATARAALADAQAEGRGMWSTPEPICRAEYHKASRQR